MQVFQANSTGWLNVTQQHRIKPVQIVQSPPEWHTHEVDPENWFKALKSELEQIEENETRKTLHPVTPRPSRWPPIFLDTPKSPHTRNL